MGVSRRSGPRNTWLSEVTVSVYSLMTYRRPGGLIYGSVSAVYEHGALTHTVHPLSFHKTFDVICDDSG